MKKVSKIVLASGIALSFSVTPELLNTTEAQAEEYVEPYYNYEGHTEYQSDFILDKNFKESLKYDNFTINGYQISKNENGKKRKELNDQTLYSVSGNKANGVFFSLDGQSVSKKALVSTYGEPIHTSPSAWGEEYVYEVGKKDVRFFFNENGYAIKGQITSN